MLRLSILLMLIVAPLAAHTTPTGSGGWGNVPSYSASSYTPTAEGVLVRLYFSDGSGIGGLLPVDATRIKVSMFVTLFTTEFWKGTDLSESLAAKVQGPIVGGDTQGVSTAWMDKKGVAHEVRTPCAGSTSAAIARCIRTHKAMVAAMQEEYPPVKPTP